MTVNGVGYYVFAAIAVIAAVGVVGQPSLHRAAYALAALGVATGLLFMDLGNELLLGVEVLVYGLAVPALSLVALDLAGTHSRREDERAAAFTGWWPFALAAACGLAALLLGVFAVSGGSWTQRGIAAGDQSTTRQMGELIFKTYALPFAVSAVLLLTALVGAVVVGRRDDLEEELEAAEEARRQRQDRMRRRREDRERARRAQRPAAALAGGDGGEMGEEE